MRKFIKRFLAAALVCGMTGCGSDAGSFVETLADGEKRDWSVEDVLKNDLEIDGIPVSIPCTLNELLEALGYDYSVDEDEIKDEFEGKATTKSKYFEGEYLSIQLYYAGESTYCLLETIADPNNINFDTINVIGFYDGMDNGIMNLKNLSAGDSLDKCLKNYGKPNEVKVSEKFTFLIYEDDACSIHILIKNSNKNTIHEISWVGLKTEDIEDEQNNK